MQPAAPDAAGPFGAGTSDTVAAPATGPRSPGARPALPPLVEPGPPLTPDESRRYARQLLLSEIGVGGQRRLKAARVLVLGAGGLGSPAIAYLAAAGVGTLGVVDDGELELSNLHRQPLHTSAGVGRAKTDSAVEAVAAINPLVTVVPVAERLTGENADRIVTGWDLVVDGLDTFAARYVAEAAAARAGIPLVWGSVLGFDGQLSVFHDGRRLTDLHPVPPAQGDVDTCSTVGVLGPLCAVIGGAMAAEAVKLIVGAGRPPIGVVLVVDALDTTWREIPLVPRAAASDADARQGAPDAGAREAATSPRRGRASAAVQARPRDDAIAIGGPDAGRPEHPTRGDGDLSLDGIDGGLLDVDVLLDVREDDEAAADPPLPGARLLPFSRLTDGERPEDVPRRARVAVYCASGRRATAAAELLADDGWRDVRGVGGIDELRAR